MGAIGDNSKIINQKIQEMAADYAKADEESMKLNDKRAEIRKRAEELGLDTKAWQDMIGRAKRDLKKKDGYDESCAVIQSALDGLNMEDLFAHVARREAEKEAAREARKAEREAEKAKNDEFKPATERKPKPSAKEVAQAQAEHFAANTVN